MLNIHKKEKKKSIVKTPVQVIDSDGIVVSLRHLDESQGNKLKDWEGAGKLSSAMSVLHGYSKLKITECQSKKFTIYGSFPPKDKTDFEHPKHVPPDAKWTRIHVDGTHCLIGHIVSNTFYLVFLDGSHKFFKTEL